MANEFKQLSFEYRIESNVVRVYKVIDLFAGIGGIRTGFQQAFKEYAQFVFSSEIDKFSAQSYQANYGESPVGDITLINETEIPQFDVLLAGFPCQPFSHAGLKKGFEDVRGTLFFDIVRIVKHHQPKVVFLENVKGFKNHDKGNTFRVVKNTLNELGYIVYAEVLNAKDFGVPQNRERIYIIGFREPLDFEFPTPPKCKVKLGDILEANVDEKYTLSDKLWDGHQRRKLEHLQKGNGFGYSLFDANSAYTSTISARYYKDGSEILIAQQGKNPRKLTPREACRLQGFPEDFMIVVSDTQAYRQFGNSVCVPVIRALAEAIFNVLLQKVK
ncbi:DNA cytosine methyltransferase [Beggiatoa leptomitoformis]|uniref:Cytosine-specific methyltransferase n=1 Tax=Beggiatoa leptomitoformis TaxID=288004 RepID=A0A2N9YJG9_9GAMM|nr:DNA cytosine methyltransferase [Beggiatoa leptomitoformis]ALG69405.2 DNA (cytosine-5-)-methyltransferase [Beggiatoa leptomitoformis]AUI70667.2 DNA (cytosine-5-)-methyltransferase [Beggiatoa leptomitoformis]